MKANVFYLLPLFAAITLIHSCKKDSDKKPECRIVTASAQSGSSTTIYNMTYNTDKKLSGLTYSNSGNNYASGFNYAGNTMIISRTVNGAFESKDSITLNSSNQPSNIRSFTNSALTAWSNFAFEYNSNGDLLKYISTSSTGGTPDVYIATSANGNLTSLGLTASSTSTIEYNMDKKALPGDFLSFSSLIQFGLNVYPHKNLVKAITNGSNIQNFDYEYDADGNISRVTSTQGTSITTVNYQYSCD